MFGFQNCGQRSMLTDSISDFSERKISDPTGNGGDYGGNSDGSETPDPTFPEDERIPGDNSPKYYGKLNCTNTYELKRKQLEIQFYYLADRDEHWLDINGFNLDGLISKLATYEIQAGKSVFVIATIDRAFILNLNPNKNGFEGYFFYSVSSKKEDYEAIEITCIEEKSNTDLNSQ